MNTIYQAYQEYQRLIAAAHDPQDLAAIAFAGVFSMRHARAAPYNVPIFGLRMDDLFSLMQRHFPGIADPSPWTAFEAGATDRLDEFEDLLDLLMRNRTIADRDSLWLAHAVATASMSDDHLWQDMGLPSRPVLSQLLGTYFTPLAQRNIGDMKWKKFFYRQLCEEAGLKVCRSPSCNECSDYLNCFGPEENTAIRLAVTT